MKPIIFLSLLLLLGSPMLSAQTDEVEAFIGNGTSDVLIDLEDKTPVNFKTINELDVKEKRLNEALMIPPRKKPPRVQVQAAPYTARLEEGTILFTIDNKNKYKIRRSIIVKAQELFPGSKKVFILNKEGTKKYYTYTEQAPNINHVVELEPTINPLTVYTDKPTFGSSDTKTQFSHFASLTFESISTDYYATIFRGQKQSANANTLQLKNYMLSNRFPIHVGFNFSTQLGFWEDPVLGTVTWDAIFFGPSVMRTFWESEKGRWNFHISAFRSLVHNSEKNPDKHSYSTLGFQGDLEKEFDTQLGPIIVGASYKWSQSSIKETTEFLANNAVKGTVASIGAYLSYRFNWSLK